MAEEQPRKRGRQHGIEDVVRGILKELAEEVDDKGRETLKKLWAKIENEEVEQVEGIIKGTIRGNKNGSKLLEKILRKLHIVSDEEVTEVGSWEDRGLDAVYDDSENRLERFKIKTINVGGVVKEGEGEDHK